MGSTLLDPPWSAVEQPLFVVAVVVLPAEKVGIRQRSFLKECAARSAAYAVVRSVAGSARCRWGPEASSTTRVHPGISLVGV